MRKRLMLALALAGGVAHAGTYTIEDLQALARHHKWDELLAHADDIPSDKRGPAWHDLVDRAAVALVDGASGGELGQLDVALSLEAHADEGSAFARKLHALIVHLSGSPATAWKAGQVAAKQGDASIAVDFFAVGNATAHCDDTLLGDAVVRALGNDPKNASTGRAHRIAASCYEHMAAPLRKELWSWGAGLDSNYFANTCGLLKAHHNLSGLQSRECAK